MKKRFILLFIAAIGIVAVMPLKPGATCNDALLNANIEALAGPDLTIIPCKVFPDAQCRYTELAVGPEGDLIVVGHATKKDFINYNPEN